MFDAVFSAALCTGLLTSAIFFCTTDAALASVNLSAAAEATAVAIK